MAILLRSPFTNVSDNELYDYLVDKKECKELTKINNDLKEILSNNSLTKALDYLWYDTGYRLSVFNKKANYNIIQDSYDYLWSIALQYEQDNKSLEDFLTYLKDNLNKNTVNSDLKFYGKSSDGVKIMTIHKSKGLEFPIVFVVGCGSKLVSDKSINFIFKDNNLFFNKFPRDNQTYIGNTYKEEIKKEELAEAKRVYYVAFTRAQSYLFITGEYKIKNSGEIYNNNSLLNLLINRGYDLDISKNTVPVIIEDSVDKEKTKNLDINKLTDLKVNTNDYDYTKEAKSASKLEDEYVDGDKTILKEYNFDKSLEKNGLITNFGTYVHKMISLKINGEDVNKELCEKEYDNTNLPKKEKDSIIKATLKMITNLFNNTKFKSMLSKDVYSEFEFTYCNDTGLYHGAIDFFVRSKSNPIVLDFKTDKSMTKEKHKNQLNLYREVSNSLLGVENTKAYVYYLREEGDKALVEV